MKETLVLVPGSCAGSFILSQDANDRCLSHGLGNAPEGRSSQGLWKDQHGMAQQSSGDVGCISCSQEFPSRYQGPPCACPLRQHIGDLLLKSPGGFAVTSTLQAGVPNPPVVPRDVVVSLSSLYPGGPQCRSRHHVETGSSVPSRGLDISPPTRTVETLGLASERGPAHRLRSLNRGC